MGRGRGLRFKVGVRHGLEQPDQGEAVPPMTSTHSRVSLNGADSKPMFLPGELERRKPKSMCTCMAKPAAARSARDRREIGAVGPRRERRCGLASSSWEGRCAGRGSSLGATAGRPEPGGGARASGEPGGWPRRAAACHGRCTPWHCEAMRRREGAVGVEQDVAVVPVLDLQEVAHDRVRGGALHEVAPGAVEGAVRVRVRIRVRVSLTLTLTLTLTCTKLRRAR